MSSRPRGEAPVGGAWTAREAAYDERLDDVRAPAWAEAVAASAAGAVVPAGAPPDAAHLDAERVEDEPADGNLRRYARWQWRDFWQRRGFWMAGAAVLGVWLLQFIATRATDGGRLLDEGRIAVIATLAFAFGGACAGLLGTGGLVARERERGLQRFLFAKPLNIVRYYLQGLAVNGVGSFLVVAGAVLLAALVLPGALPIATIVGLAMLTYALASGLTFLVSTLLRYDAPVAAAWLFAGFPVTVAAQATLAGEARLWWAVPLQWLFPQGAAVEAFKALAPTSFGDLTSVSPVVLPLMTGGLVGAAYGLLCVAVGVAVLRRRSIQT